jgi:hypothetical protein
VNLLQQNFCTLKIARPDKHSLPLNLALNLAMVVAEIKLGHVALQVLFAHAMERSNDTPLENRKVPLDCVRVNVAAHVFASEVIDRLVASNPWPSSKQRALAIGHKTRFSCIQVFCDDGLECLGVDDGNMERAHATVTLHQRKHALLADGAATFLRFALAGVFVVFLAADIRRIGFNRGAARAKHTARLHCFAQAMRHKPRSLVGYAQHALDLFRADTFLAARYERGCEHPFIKADLRALEYRPYRYGELIAALAALIQSGAMRLALQLGNALQRATTRDGPCGQRIDSRYSRAAAASWKRGSLKEYSAMVFSQVWPKYDEGICLCQVYTSLKLP